VRARGRVGRPPGTSGRDAPIAPEPRLTLVGDSALVLEFAEFPDARMDVAINRRVHAVATAIVEARLQGVRDVVPAFDTVAVHFEPLRTEVGRLLTDVRRIMEIVAAAPEATQEVARPVIRLPVCYGGEYGPDLEQVAALTGLTVSEVVERHASSTYRVFMVGFSPGFPYLGIVDERLRVPRLPVPRTRVPAGSVGIAGAQTGIYPIETPGGWHILGRTPLCLFDLERLPPNLLGPGNLVRFEPIEASVYTHQAARTRKTASGAER